MVRKLSDKRETARRRDVRHQCRATSGAETGLATGRFRVLNRSMVKRRAMTGLGDTGQANPFGNTIVKREVPQ